MSQEELKSEHVEYLEQHPEMQRILDDFTTSCLLQQPVDVFQFANEYFSNIAIAKNSAAGMSDKEGSS